METKTLQIGEYIRNWCFQNGVSRKQLQLGSKVSLNTNIFQAQRISVDRALNIAQYMSSKSVLPTYFYLHRLAQVHRGDFRQLPDV